MINSCRVAIIDIKFMLLRVGDGRPLIKGDPGDYLDHIRACERQFKLRKFSSRLRGILNARPTDGHIAASALAGGAIAIGLFNLLIDKGVISRSDALGILKEAQGFLKDFAWRTRRRQSSRLYFTNVSSRATDPR